MAYGGCYYGNRDHDEYLGPSVSNSVAANHLKYQMTLPSGRAFLGAIMFGLLSSIPLIIEVISVAIFVRTFATITMAPSRFTSMVSRACSAGLVVRVAGIDKSWVGSLQTDTQRHRSSLSNAALALTSKTALH